MVLDCLAEADLKLKPSKCSLFQKRVKFLRSIISENGIELEIARPLHDLTRKDVLLGFPAGGGFSDPQNCVVECPCARVTY